MNERFTAARYLSRVTKYVIGSTTTLLWWYRTSHISPNNTILALPPVCFHYNCSPPFSIIHPLLSSASALASLPSLPSSLVSPFWLAAPLPSGRRIAAWGSASRLPASRSYSARPWPGDPPIGLVGDRDTMHRSFFQNWSSTSTILQRFPCDAPGPGGGVGG